MRRAALIILVGLLAASIVVAHAERTHQGVVAAIAAIYVASAIVIGLITARS